MSRKLKTPVLENALSIIPLGGVGEIGKNMMLYEFDGHILIVDCGVMFPDEETLGVDLIIPDMTYVSENKERVCGIVITHGHEDHVGGVPYLLREVTHAPIYGGKLTLGLLQEKIKEHKIDTKSLALETVTPGDTVPIGPFEVEFVRVSHSIPDGMGLGIHTPVGTVVQTGDFKFDPTPIDENMMHFSKFAEMGSRGVLALLSDCTNVERPGFTPSERAVRPHLEEVIRNAPKRVIIATFASHVHRVQQVIDLSAQYGRKVAPTGRSMISTLRIASELGYLRIPPDTLISIDDINAYPPHEITVLTTGTQGEPMSALALIARQDHRRVKISEGDIVLLSAKPVPGNEHLVHQVINHLYRQGAEVLYDPVDPVHVSGHGNQEDLKLMLNLIRPKFVAPYHGEARHMIRYAKLAESVGVPKENIFLLKLGDVLSMTADAAAITNSVPAGNVMIDGLGVGDVGAAVLRDRRHLAEEGMLIVVISVSRQTGEVLSGPDIISRGFVYEPLSEEFLERAKEKVAAVLAHLSKARVTEWGSINATVRETLSKFIYNELRRRPMVVPIVMEV